MSWQEPQEPQEPLDGQPDSWGSSEGEKGPLEGSASSTAGHFIELQQEASEGSEDHGIGMGEDEEDREDMELLAEIR